ncbi:PREDICTED: probable G-protein coupled receptor 128 [Condylura cristata]|uniref:probable G-protein coupled receptor 128 n=1 Tax=Condylura cristata TaxID=143302 RepID=UPI0003345C67|nr:PREDICTED: probable G-protein coupled receptor 128 [Condylura cristata]
MASLRACNLRMLLAVVCGLLTTVVLGLSIWRTVVYQKGTLSSSSNIPTSFCKNGGTWMNGRCICPEEWKGLRCTIINYCESGPYENYTFKKIPVGRYGYSLETCGPDTPNGGKPLATCLCDYLENGMIGRKNMKIGNCSETLQTLELQAQDISASTSETISTNAQILTSNASKLTPDNITSAANVATKIITSEKASSKARQTAVVTVSQLLDASEDVFQEAATLDNQTAFAKLIKIMENYSTSLGGESVVEPNIAIQSVKFSGKDSKTNTALFSIMKGSSKFFDSSSISVEENVHNYTMKEQLELQILLSTSNRSATGCGFVVYQNNKFFQSKTFTTYSNFSQKIISGKTGQNGTINTFVKNDQSTFVKMAINPEFNSNVLQIHSFACVYWNTDFNDWDTDGCYKESADGEKPLRCRCDHTTNFAVLMSFKKKYVYLEPLDKLSTAGCALSIAGLLLTIIFQIFTRNVRKTSVTWVVVSLCTSMLIFNLLFVFGIENSNKPSKADGAERKNDMQNEVPQSDLIEAKSNPTCTVIAALLHYFLLVTFTWSGISATQLYYLLIRTMKPLPRNFILVISLVGWGVPAIVVAVTVGTTYALAKEKSNWEINYRQEPFCWLKTFENDSVLQSPFLWSFIMPVTIILISNVTIFIIITVKVLWKNNQNLTSTKKVSHIKKIFSTLSVAVVFGITWILAYLMLIENDVGLVFSYLFCIFNSTQGLQIFLLYTVRTKIFLNEASRVLKLMSSSAQRMKPSMATLSLNLRMYNLLRSFPSLYERFTLLEPSIITEETTVSESFREN